MKRGLIVAFILTTLIFSSALTSALNVLYYYSDSEQSNMGSRNLGIINKEGCNLVNNLDNFIPRDTEIYKIIINEKKFDNPAQALIECQNAFNIKTENIVTDQKTNDLGQAVTSIEKKDLGSIEDVEERITPIQEPEERGAQERMRDWISEHLPNWFSNLISRYRQENKSPI